MSKRYQKKSKKSERKYKSTHKRKKTKRKKKTKSRKKRRKSGMIGQLSSHLMYRYLSRDDKNAINLINLSETSENYIFLLYSEITRGSQPYKIKFNDIDLKLKKSFAGLKVTKSLVSKIKTGTNKQKLDKVYVNAGIENAFMIRIPIIETYFPISAGPELLRKEITVHQYLTSDAFVNTRSSHGIHGFFIYDSSDVLSGKTARPNFYEDYGFSRREPIPKEIFLTSFQATEIESGGYNGGSFNDIFINNENEKIEPTFINCEGGEATVATGDESGLTDFGKDATCRNFELEDYSHTDKKRKIINEIINAPKLVNSNLVYARLGRLMPRSTNSYRRNEINFRGTGNIHGFHVKMNNCDIIFDQSKLNKEFSESDEILPLLNSLKEELNTRIKTEDKTIRKRYFGEIHSKIIKEYEKTLVA